MKNRKAFTIVELIGVILILSIIAIILIPNLTNSSQKAKERMLSTKIETSTQSLILWAQNNRKCFFSDATSYGDVCVIGINKDCTMNDAIVNCEVSLGELAENGIIKYDNENIIINPVDNSSMNERMVSICYNQQSKLFNTGDNCTDISSTSPSQTDYNTPYIVITPDKDASWSKTKNIEVTLNSGNYGFKSGGRIDYAWVSSLDETGIYNNIPIDYNNGDKQINVSIPNSDLSGKYYLKVKTSFVTTNNIILGDKNSSDKYWYDNELPLLSYVNHIGSPTGEIYNEGWTNQTIYTVLTYNDTISGIDKNTLQYKEGTNAYTKIINNVGNTSYIGTWSANRDTTGYHKICDNAGNCTEVSYELKIDKVEPTVNISATKKGTNTTVASNTWSNAGLNFTLTKGTTGNSGYTIYYCKDTNNTCNPNIKVANDTVITDYNTLTGEYYIRYQIVNGVGSSSEVGSYHAKVDLTRPELTVSVPNGATYAKSQTATITISDSGSGLASGTYTINYAWSTSEVACSNMPSTITITATSGVTSASSTITMNDGTGAGKLYICNAAAITDLATNSLAANTTKNANMYLDNRGPIIIFRTNGSSSTVNTASTTVTVVDSHSGSVKNLKYAWSNSNTTIPTFSSTFSNGQTITKTGVSGAYYLWIYAEDNLGNSTITKSNAFNLSSNYCLTVKSSVGIAYVYWDANLTNEAFGMNYPSSYYSATLVDGKYRVSIYNTYYTATSGWDSVDLSYCGIQTTPTNTTTTTTTTTTKSGTLPSGCSPSTSYPASFRP